MFKRILIANRGEIAVRVFRACREMDIEPVVVYSQADADALHVQLAERAYCIGPARSADSYLNVDAILTVAQATGCDAIHPGYGFLSENAAFAKACEDAGIKFIGPPSHVLAKMGDKLEAKKMAVECGVPVIPGTREPLKNAAEAEAKAQEFGFPVILKAAAGGGGRGMRLCQTLEEVAPAFELVSSEARKAFGDDSIFMEKYLVEPKHIEVQILADEHGNVRHLGERDCSLQRRYQKVVEFCPAWSVPEEVRERLRADAVKIAEAVGYVNAGTVEFLVDKNGSHYFIEMNPRIQVEHTVTEMVTGIDLVRAQILIAEGATVAHPEIGLEKQSDLYMNGYSIQCRVTTEDPKNNFAPDNGKIVSYRSGGGFGVRLDGGNAAAGAEISPYYDSLLVKVTTWDRTFEAVCRKARRAINEEHVRGVKTNISFVTNILNHPTFIEGKCHTKFIDETPELFDIEESRDRATRVLRYIANIQVANPDAQRREYSSPRYPAATREITRADGLKELLDTKGPEAVSRWVMEQKKLLVTDTTMRDAHQSLLSTRMRTRDMVKGAEGTADFLADCFSLEMWGGATFDTAYRFLYESPWERLIMLREKIPNIPFQMLLRGSNLVGYASYPDNLVNAFIEESAKYGIDVFRVFDSLNWIPSMETAMEAVLKTGKILEATVCYTGDILDPKRDKYTLKYYVDFAKELEKRGAHMICVKDMSGLLKPYAAKKLVKALKDEVGVPIHLHTHNTTDNQIATYLLAAEAGVDVVDCAIGPLSSLTSQPSLNSLVEALRGTERDTGLPTEGLQKLADYWSDVRERYGRFDKGLRTPVTDIYRYEIPGGQYTNLQPQVEALGLGQLDELGQVLDVDVLLGDGLGDQHHVGVDLGGLAEELLVGHLGAQVVGLHHLVALQAVVAGEALAVHDGVDAHGVGVGTGGGAHDHHLAAQVLLQELVVLVHVHGLVGDGLHHDLVVVDGVGQRAVDHIEGEVLVQLLAQGHVGVGQAHLLGDEHGSGRAAVVVLHRQGEGGLNLAVVHGVAVGLDAGQVQGGVKILVANLIQSGAHLPAPPFIMGARKGLKYPGALVTTPSRPLPPSRGRLMSAKMPRSRVSKMPSCSIWPSRSVAFFSTSLARVCMMPPSLKVISLPRSCMVRKMYWAFWMARNRSDRKGV